jgi:hypothetical protein
VSKLKTDNFVIRSAMSKRKAINLARDLEYFRAAVALMTNVTSTKSNIPALKPLLQVDFGQEYITALVSDAGNTTVIEPPKAPFGSDRHG